MTELRVIALSSSSRIYHRLSADELRTACGIEFVQSAAIELNRCSEQQAVDVFGLRLCKLCATEASA